MLYCDSYFTCVKFVTEGLIDNKPGLIQILAWCRTSDKPWHDSKLNQITNTFASLGSCVLKEQRRNTYYLVIIKIK